jgi:hypothetical protein
MIKNQRFIFIGIIFLLVLALGWAYLSSYGKNTSKTSPTQPGITQPTDNVTPDVICTMDAKICPDGSSVGRTGPNCEFTACPGEGNGANGTTQPTTQVPANWETYNATEFGFSFAYPPTAEVTIQESFPPTIVVFQKGPAQTGETELYDGLSVSFTPQQKATPTDTLLTTLETYLSQQTTDGAIQVTQPLRPITVNGTSGYTYTLRGLGEYTSVAIELPQPGWYLTITSFSSDVRGTTFQDMGTTIISSVKVGTNSR